jgi:L-ribulose-5-phosphate 3-epimerase
VNAPLDRRRFLAGACALGAGLAGSGLRIHGGPLYSISLAQWSLHRTLRAGLLSNLDFPAFARERFDIHAVEFVNVFFREEIREKAYVPELRRRADQAGVRCLLIMCDGLGRLGDRDGTARERAVENHRPWLEAAATLGCHAIRVNAHSEGSFDEQMQLAADGLRRLCEQADPFGIDVLVENHGGLSSHGGWLSGTIRLVAHRRAGTLPDFGNFDLGGGRRYDRYQGVRELMPLARAVSAKSHAFDAAGLETSTDFHRMLGIVVSSGYRGHVGIEYEGSAHSEEEGIRLTQALLLRTEGLLAGG